MERKEIDDLLSLLDSSLSYKDGRVRIEDPENLPFSVHRLAEVSAMESGVRQGMARYLTRLAAHELGIFPASIHDLYIARGRGEVPPTFTVPALNLRALSFEAARGVFRAALSMDAGAFIFEIARSEMVYTDQRPAEYVTNILAAAIAEGYQGPVFIQGDHFQVSAKRYTADPKAEMAAVRELAQEAISAGFYNIDVDTSTLVDLSKDSIEEQQFVNSSLSAAYTAFIRSLEPKGITISVGGEIGEVGGSNSTEPELRAYMDLFKQELEKIAPGAQGLSKISIQTGTSHGGVVLPDGSIKEVNVDFDTLRALSQLARREYGLGGAVQHGASTLPESAFGKFVESEAIEVHLATNFQNMLFDRLPTDLRDQMYAYLDENYAQERKEGMTDIEFYYKTRKNAIGPFKGKLWALHENSRDDIRRGWEDTFTNLFSLLGLRDTRIYTEQTIKKVIVKPDLQDYLGEAAGEEDVRDLAD